MSVLVDARPPSLGAKFRPGNTFDLTLTWPADVLDGRSFTATLDAATLTVAVVADMMTVSATAAQTTTAGVGAHEFTLTETTGGLDQAVIVGRWVGSTQGATSQSTSVEVTESTATVSVSVAAAPGAQEVVHDWDADGWDAFTASTMTEDGDDDFFTTVDDDRGVVGSVGIGGSVRVAYIRDHTNWEDSQITSLIYGPGDGADWVGNNAQQGHIHRVQEIEPGVMTGFAVWTSVVFGLDYRHLHCTTVRWDGTTLTQAPGGVLDGSDTAAIDRRLAIRSKDRVLSGSDGVNSHRVSPLDAYGLAVGDIVTVDCDDATFDETEVELTGVSNGYVSLLSTSQIDVVAADFAEGTITPAGVDSQKRWTPFWMSSRVRTVDDGTVLVEVKRWRPEDPEPDWADSRVRRATLVAGGGVPVLPTGAGRCALWAAHFYDGSHGSWGEARFTRLLPAATATTTATALALPGVDGSDATTAANADIRITGDIDIRVDVEPDSWTPAADSALIARWGDGPTRSWRLFLLTNGSVRLYWSPDGGTPTAIATSTTTIGVTGRKIVRAALDVDTGAGWEVTFYTGDTLDGPWTVDSTLTGAPATPVFAGTVDTPLRVGSAFTAGTDPLAGTVYGARLYDGIDGTLVADIDFTEQTPGATVIYDDTDRLWAINGTAEIVETP